MKKYFSVLTMLLVLSGCYPKVTNENVYTISDADLCVAYTATAASGWQLTRQEILRRGLLSAEDLNQIDQRTIRVGMPECGVLSG
jgi:ABC-type uncharacterized transport system auxiliary subunit